MPSDVPSDWRAAPPIYRAVYDRAYGIVKLATNARVAGTGNVPREGPLIVAANHLSVLDPFFLGLVVPRPIHWLAKKEVFNGRFWTSFFENAGVTPVDRSARGSNVETLRAAVDALENGLVVGIFPEGTRQRVAGRLGDAKTGVARLALMTGAAVLPVGLAGDTLFGRGMIVPRLGRRAYVNVGKPMPVPRAPALAEDRATCRRLADDVMAHVSRLLHDALAAREACAPWPRPVKVRSREPKR